MQVLDFSLSLRCRGRSERAAMSPQHGQLRAEVRDAPAQQSQPGIIWGQFAELFGSGRSQASAQDPTAEVFPSVIPTAPIFHICKIPQMRYLPISLKNNSEKNFADTSLYLTQTEITLKVCDFSKKRMLSTNT